MTYHAHLCQLAGTWGGHHPPPGALAECKIDGWRAVHLRGVDGLPRLFTRGGMIIEGAGHISHRIALMEQAAGCQLVIDGEFQVGGTLKTTKAWCEANWKEGGEAGTLFAFDCITQAEWKAGGSDVPLHKRKARLVALWHAAQALATDEWDWRPRSRGSDTDTQPVRVLPHVQVFIRQDVIELAHRVWGFGGEGLMIKDIVGGYQRNRSRDWLKVKQGQAWQQRSA